MAVGGCRGRNRARKECRVLTLESVALVPKPGAMGKLFFNFHRRKERPERKFEKEFRLRRVGCGNRKSCSSLILVKDRSKPQPEINRRHPKELSPQVHSHKIFQQGAFLLMDFSMLQKIMLTVGAGQREFDHVWLPGILAKVNSVL